MKNEMTVKVASAAEIADGLRNAAVALVDVARRYTAALEVRPELKQELLEMGITVRSLNELERLGKGIVDERLALGYFPARPALLDLTPSDQKKALDEGVEVLDDKGEVRCIPVADLSPAQVRQVFASGTVRTLAQQRTYLQEKMPRSIDVQKPDYEIGRDFVRIRKPGKFSRSVLANWLAQMA